MARKAETTFISSVHKHLPLGVHREKMNNPYRSGTADVWYSGRADLWIEYKFIPALPKKAKTMIVLDLSENQKIWLRQRFDEGRSVAVICGCKDGGVVFTHPVAWERGITADAFEIWIRSRAELASWILSMTGEVVHAPTKNHLRSSETR